MLKYFCALCRVACKSACLWSGPSQYQG